MDYQEARLLRFVEAFHGKAEGDRIKALELTGDEYGSPLALKRYSTKYKEYISDRLYQKAVYRGLINPTKMEVVVEEVLSKERLLDLLSRQATGEKPTRRTEVLRKNPETGLLEAVEVRTEHDEIGSQENLAKILGLFKEIPKAPTTKVEEILAKMTGMDREEGEDLLLEASLHLLDSPEEQG